MATQETLDRVQALYVAYYGRPADQEGQEYWADRIEAEGEGAIINAFGTSAEYTERFGDQSNADAINNLYNQMFGRDAEPNGLAYWSGVLNNGEKSLAEIATTILNAAGGQDRQVVNAKVEAAAEYTRDFGAADDYDLEAATAVVVNADGGVYVPEVTEAIETLASANQALEDFLASDAVDFDEDPETSATPTQVTDNLSTAQTALSDDITADGSTNQLNADLQLARANLADINEEIAQISGLRSAVATLQAAEEAEVEATEAATAATTELDVETAAFETRNGGTLTVDPDGTASIDAGADFLVLNADNELVIDQDAVEAQELEGVDALFADVQANLAAQQALTEATNAVGEAEDAVDDLGGTALYGELQTQQDTITALETDLEERAELVADVAEAQALVDQLNDLQGNITEAVEAFDDLDVDLNGEDDVTSTEDDLYIFDAETGLTTGGDATFSFEGEDLFFIGDAFTRVDLEEDDVLGEAAFGESGTLEVFFQQNANGTDVDLFFEGEAFQGNAGSAATPVFEGNTITLTGVNVEDLQLENGYITVA